MSGEAERRVPLLTDVLAAGHAVEIRATHPAGFRSGEWAVVTGAAMVRGRSCYTVRFPDGVIDEWPRFDPDDTYEFRGALDPSTPAEGDER